jgi:DNA-binding NarL/FixJ family response regulator
MPEIPSSVLAAVAEEAPRELERLSLIKTHEFRNVRAAARLLYGAFDCGDMGEAALREADARLKSLDVRFGGAAPGGDTDGPRKIGLDQFIAEANMLRQSAFPEPGRPLSSALGDARVLLIDDEYQRFGWDVVLDAIFGDGRVIYRDRADAALKRIEEHPESLGLVLLDLGLKDRSGAPSPGVGLNLLKAIKGACIDLPVVVFSGVDETIYTRRCLHAGAFDYYVKETAEKERIQYYLKFKEIVLDALSHPEWRAIWRRLKRLPKQNPHLLRAYYFLTTDPDNYRLQLMFSEEIRKSCGDPSIYAECILHCALAVEDWINKTVSRQRKRFDKKYKGITGLSIHDLPLRKRGQLSKLSLLGDEGKINEDQLGYVNELLNLRISIAHPRRRGTTLTPRDSLRAFELALEVLG